MFSVYRLIQITVVVAVFTWAVWNLVWLLRELWREIVREWRWTSDYQDWNVERRKRLEDHK